MFCEPDLELKYDLKLRFKLSPPGLTKGAGVLPDGPLNAAVGATVMFTTTLTPSDKPFLSVVWTFGTKNIITSSIVNKTGPEYEGRITLFMSTGSLELRNLALNDSGEYSVSIVPDGEPVKGGSTTLKVLGEQMFDISFNLVEFNSSVRLSCSSSGSSLSFLWLNSSSEVTASDRVQLTDGGSILTIVKVTRYDQGPFRCRVSNPVSNGTSDPITLSISCELLTYISFCIVLSSQLSVSLLLFTYFFICHMIFCPTERISGAFVTPTTNLMIEGISVNLTCDAAGSVFTRKWMKDGSDLTLAGNMNLYDKNKVLSFNSLKSTDSGEYSCKISNPLKLSNIVFPDGPENVQITGPREIHLGASFTLTCSADSTPSVTYTWKLNGTEIHNSAEFTKDNAELSDSGCYTCQAMNSITERTSTAVHGLSVTGTEMVLIVDFVDTVEYCD
uniref:Ig-like domain-containing protein n=1 Tax=Sander lucioperca TaxID=283035 RepID=A0A8C9ZYD6_SANLU